jgi:hypothetical protein
MLVVNSNLEGVLCLSHRIEVIARGGLLDEVDDVAVTERAAE